MNDMRKLMEMVESSGYENAAYLAAKLYLSHPGLVKPALAKELSEQAGIDYDIAVLMIDAIDAYEDIREAPEVWELGEDSIQKDDLSRKKCESCDGEGETGIEGWKETCLSCAGSGYDD